MQDAQGNITTLGYEEAGRKVAMGDPDIGSWTYGYDAASNLTSQTDARSVSTNLTYDALNRLTLKQYVNANGEPNVSYTYDDAVTDGPCQQSASGKGHLGKEQVTGLDATYHCYDVLGRETLTRTNLTGDTTNYDIGRAFDDLGQVTDLTYPDGEAAHFNESPAGDVYGMTSTTTGQRYVKTSTWTPWGATASVQLGNGLTTRQRYDYRERLTNIQTGSVQASASTTTTLATSRPLTDLTTGESAAYTYDDLNRLTRMAIDGDIAASYSPNR